MINCLYSLDDCKTYKALAEKTIVLDTFENLMNLFPDARGIFINSFPLSTCVPHFKELCAHKKWSAFHGEVKSFLLPYEQSLPNKIEKLVNTGIETVKEVGEKIKEFVTFTPKANKSCHYNYFKKAVVGKKSCHVEAMPVSGFNIQPSLVLVS